MLFAAVTLTYLPAGSGGYIWDDDVVLTANPVIIGPLGLKEIWTRAASSPMSGAADAQHVLWLEHSCGARRPSLTTW